MHSSPSSSAAECARSSGATQTRSAAASRSRAMRCCALHRRARVGRAMPGAERERCGGRGTLL
eukprot:737660-Rhodomonas_salina.2